MSHSVPLQALLQQCEQEPLAYSGAIQPHGALLCIDADSQFITHASANLQEFTGLDAKVLLGQVYTTVDWLQRSLQTLSFPLKKSLFMERVSKTEEGQWFDLRLIHAETVILVEIERSQNRQHYSELQHYQRLLLKPPDSATDLIEYHQILLQAVQVVTGLSRLMIYQFHPDWSGEVIAELAAPGLGSYLGLRYPASDIPAIARQLYLRNPVRYIPDIRAEPVLLLSADGSSADLSLTDLRSVSPIHVQYLSNMGVAASCSFPIVIGGQLWGLLACHHYLPLKLSPAQRRLCANVVTSYKLGLAHYFTSHRLKLLDSLERRAEKILRQIFDHPDPQDNIEKNADTLMAAFDAEGFAAVFNQNVVTVGMALEFSELAVLDQYLTEHEEGILVHDHLIELFPNQALPLAVAGVLAIKADSRRQIGRIHLYWFRVEEKQEIAWAGNPNKPILEDAGALILSPRRSFEKWVEVRSGYCRPWSDAEKLLANRLRNMLLSWL